MIWFASGVSSLDLDHIILYMNADKFNLDLYDILFVMMHFNRIYMIEYNNRLKIQ